MKRKVVLGKRETSYCNQEPLRKRNLSEEGLNLGIPMEVDTSKGTDKVSGNLVESPRTFTRITRSRKPEGKTQDVDDGANLGYNGDQINFASQKRKMNEINMIGEDGSGSSSGDFQGVEELHSASSANGSTVAGTLVHGTTLISNSVVQKWSSTRQVTRGTEVDTLLQLRD
ncbi:protein TolB [Striga asiatica]|uniref:Protein TolB n=1 Tax=Striga asiatica TaxID=4170 RepID=A0A5A7QGW8_STRAF|nr:protein TolB [Striga asiatica]